MRNILNSHSECVSEGMKEPLAAEQATEADSTGNSELDKESREFKDSDYNVI